MRRLVPLWLFLLGLAAPAGAAPLPAGAPLTTGFAEALVRAALPADSAFQITIDQPALPLGNTAARATELVLEQFQYDPTGGRFSGALVGTLDGSERFRLPIVGRVEPVLRVPVLRRAVAPDEMIGEADLTWLEAAPASLPPASITEAAQIVGSQARRRLGAGRVLTERDLGPPYLVRRGHPVELIYARRGLYVTALGVAQEDGALGDPVRVINAASRRQLQGVVSGPDEVAFRTISAATGQPEGGAP